MKSLWQQRQGLAAEGKQLRKELEDAKVELECERSLRKDHERAAFLLAHDRQKLLRLLANERCVLQRLVTKILLSPRSCWPASGVFATSPSSCWHTTGRSVSCCRWPTSGVTDMHTLRLLMFGCKLCMAANEALR